MKAGICTGFQNYNWSIWNWMNHEKLILRLTKESQENSSNLRLFQVENEHQASLPLFWVEAIVTRL